ncbi:FecCD family ABC transporter permease [Nakamurella alba]|uniref:FecCD family ABC transporter permease n=1 Tax=Nakamurella alba TaxID=2665158 RepID=UPI0018A95289|nr:iron chelate uptake ABC transporter family permease subunit [Nakamurella alba]
MSAPTTTRRRGLAPVTVVVGGLIVCVVIIFLTIGTGPLPVAPLEVLTTVFGSSTDNEFAVMDVGLPRSLLALLCGMALGVGGSLLQAHSRNPLGTPDIIGFSAGAAAGAVIAIVPLKLDQPEVGIAAVAGGLITAAVVFFLAGGAHRAGYRLIVVGIGIGALLTGVTTYLLTRARISDAREAQRWLTGSLNTATWSGVLVMLVAVAIVVPAGMALRRYLLITDLGEEAAVGLGVRPRRVGTAVVIVSVLSAAAVVNVVGPIAFVDLAAPQIAIRLIRLPGPLVLSSAVVGGVCLLASDLLAQRLLGDIDVPVGVATGVVGGIYLAWLLLRMWRSR